MLESSEKKEKLIQYLSAVRDSELSKPVDETDTEVEYSCVSALTVRFDESVPEAMIDLADEVIEDNGLQCYVCRPEEVRIIQIYFMYNGDCYILGGTDEQVLLSIIENLE